MHNYNMPFFSIVLPTYNRGYILSKAIDSVLNQTFLNWELLIVDDGSTDNTKELVLRYIETDDRIKYIYQNNKERSSARNTGVLNSKGSYVTFLDSDDYYLCDRLKVFNEYILNNKDVLFMYSGVIHEYLGVQKKIPMPNNSIDNVADFFLTQLIGTPQVCIHRDCFQYNLFNESLKVGEDTELWLRICEKTPPFPILNYTFVALVHDDRSVNFANYNSGEKLLETYAIVFSKNHPGSKCNKNIKKRCISKASLKVAVFYIFKNIRIKAVIFLLKSIFIDINDKKTKNKIILLFNLLLFRPMDKVKMYL